MIKYNVHGNNEGKLMVFITGAGVSSWMYKYQQKFFKDYKTIFFDLPGHGKNYDLVFTSLDNVAIEIREIIKKESTDEKAIIIGHSIGAQIIMHMMKSPHEYMDKAVIISGLNKKIKGISWMIKPMVSNSMPLVKYRWFAKAQAKELALPEDMFENYYKDSLKISKETLQNIMKENMSFELGSASTPTSQTLILVGANEKNIMLKSAAKTKQAIQHSCAYIVKNASHGMPYEQPELVNEMIKDFIEDKKISANNIIAL